MLFSLTGPAVLTKNVIILILPSLNNVSPPSLDFKLLPGPRTLGALIKISRQLGWPMMVCTWWWAARVIGEATVIPPLQ